MMSRSHLFFVAGGIVLAGGLWFGLGPKNSSALPPTSLQSLNVKPTAEELNQERSNLERFVAENPSLTEQQKVALAHRTVKLGYAVAQSGDFKEAKSTFDKVAAKFSKSSSPELKRLAQDAIHQSSVCLEAMGKKVEAIAAYRQQMTEHATSPIAMAGFRRLTRLGLGENDPLDVQRMNRAVQQQEDAIQTALAACGPKAIAYVLQRYQSREVSVDEIATRSKQTQEGTTLKDMISALESYGVSSAAFEYNAADFARAKTPFIWLHDRHYVVVTGRRGNTLELFDPLSGRDSTATLPSSTDPKFRAVLLTLNLEN